MKILTFYLLLGITFLSCKKEHIETFQPMFQYDLGGVTQKIQFKNDFLTNGFLQFSIQGETLLSLDLVSVDTTIQFGFLLNRPDPYWNYYVGNINNADSRAFFIQHINSNVNKYYTGGGVIKLTKDEAKNTQYGRLKIRSGTFDLTLYDSTGRLIRLENGYFSLPYKAN